MLEDNLRELFAAQVEQPPAMQDPADEAIRRARRIRRRRAACSSAAAALVLVLAVGGLMSLRQWLYPVRGDEPVGRDIAQPEVEPSPKPSLGRLSQRARSGPEVNLQLVGLDLRVGHQLWTTEGKRLSLTGVGLVKRVYRVPVGWVYGGAEHVRLLRADGTSVLLHSAGERWLVSPDGQRMAYVEASELHVATIVTGGLNVDASVVVPDGTTPVAFAGDHLVVSAGAGGPFDSVDPSIPYRPTWNTGVVAIYGAAGETVTGLVRDTRRKAVCLAAMRPAGTGLTVTRTGACKAAAPAGAAEKTTAAPKLFAETSVAVQAESWLAPDGGYLAELDRKQILLVNLDRTLSGDRVTVTCPVATIVPPAWVDGTTVVAANARAVVRCRTDGTSQVLPLPGGLSSDWNFVPKLTAAKPN
ncbi:MAG TPA: hypothetical protein VFR67_23845 [Pilimelia sp.]|nr:hypothetical protein [Pilimelia sp.]